MKYLIQFGIIAGVCFLGEILKSVIPIAVPASIYGLVIMFILLLTGVLKIDMVEDTADYLVAIMPIMFVPPIVGLIDSYTLICDVLWKIMLVTVLTTVVVMVTAGSVAQLILKLTGKREGKE